ncbi:Alpha-tocopherol transfer protein-like [Gryllus bimaculatus]|nr:Alpha-tocopherol transfer protein-like [Gryllus bimaculatus]
MAPTLQELLKTSPRLSRTDLEYLQDWTSKQPHLPRMEDVDLVPVLHRCDYSLERTKELLDKYLTMRTHAPEIFKYRDPRLPDMKEQIKLLQKRHDPSAFDPEACAFIAFAFAEFVIRGAPTSPGFVFVMDASQLTTTHITKPSISLIKKVLAFVQDGVPSRIVAVHVIRLNPVVDRLMMLIKPLLSKETQERELLANVDWLQSLDARVVDERLRPGRAKGEGDVFGVDGSFKRLDFD